MLSFLATSTLLSDPLHIPNLFDIISSEHNIQAQNDKPFPYPPPFLFKREEWYLPNANLFLSVRGKLYGLRREKFPRTCFFLDDAYRIHDNELYPRGFTLTRPFPVDHITHWEFEEFLIFLYYTEHFHGNEARWRRVCLLAGRWHFPYFHNRAYIELQYFRYRQHCPQTRRFLMDVAPLTVRMTYRRRLHRRLLVESDVEEEIPGIDDDDDGDDDDDD
jgi:hypothetical protein